MGTPRKTLLQGPLVSSLRRQSLEMMPAMLRDLQKTVEQESPTHNLDAVAASALLLSRIGEERLGAAPELLRREGASHLRWRFGTGPRRVLLLAHHDTVWPIGSLADHPWSLIEGVIRGPGCFDMKTGVLQAICALQLLQTNHTRLDGVTLLVTGDEETGSLTSRELIESEAKGCKAAFVLEASAPEGALKTERKGVSLYTVSTAGLAAHAGLEPHNGVNAGLELAHQALAIAQLGDEALGTTVTPTVMSAGSTTNTVPAHGRVSVDVRVRTRREQARVHRAITTLTPVLPGSSLSVVGGPNRPPLDEASSQALFNRASEIAESIGLGALFAASVGGASDGNFTAGIGTPTLDGLGAVGGGAHADDEHVIAEEIPGRILLLALLIADQLGETPANENPHRTRTLSERGGRS